MCSSTGVRCCGELSLDYDLRPGEPDGYAVCEWMSRNNVWPQTVRVHSSSRRGTIMMCSFLEAHGYRQTAARTFSRRA
jgi:hypothetical protein